MNLIDSGRLRVLFQPIHNIKSGAVIGYEALARGPEGSSLELPKKLFKAARRAGGRQELEMACFRTALSEYRTKLFDYGALLFVNFHPVILSGCLNEIMSELDGFREKTVIEVTESSRLKLRRCVYDKLKEKGVRIALDDVGVGDRSFSSICDVEVDYLKVDKGVVRGISSGNGNANKYKFLLTFLAEFGEKSGARVITEGVETSEQVSLTEKIGIELMQGFYFSKPKPAEYWVKHLNGRRQDERNCPWQK